MARVYTFTKTSTMQPENIEEIASSLTPPTREEVMTQLKDYFSKHDKEAVTPEDIELITENVCVEFDYLADKPYGGFAKYMPERPKLTIRRYSNEWELYNTESRPRDYSPIKKMNVVCSNIVFSVTVVTYLKWISLSYVSEECTF